MSAEEKSNDDSLAAAVKAMEDLVDEAVQVYEIDKEKTNVIDDLYNSLKIITSYLSFSLDLQPQILNLPEDHHIILTSNLDLLIVQPNFKSETKRFDQLTLDETTNVLRYTIPTIINMARADREIKSKKIAFLREGAKKLKRLPSVSHEESIITDVPQHIEKVEN
jgi:hypothetical protein